MTAGNFGSHVIIIGAGFCGLTVAYELVKKGVPVTVLEREAEVGGLAGSFTVNGVQLEKFYHHWFTSDRYINDLVEELGATDQVMRRSTRTGIYYANNFFKLSSPLDVARFRPLRPFDRLRLGMLVLRARKVQDWTKLEHLSATEWLLKMGGKQVYEVVWEPLLRGKFGGHAEEISAVWFWNKLKLRGGSRDNDGAEQLAYYRGGFAALATKLVDQIRLHGGTVITDAPVEKLSVSEGRVTGVLAGGRTYQGDLLIATPSLPVIADLVEPYLSTAYVARLRRIKYLANICIVLELDRSLSETYWLNVNDPSFPFVGVVEHTNFEPPETYNGQHIVYLSKYLSPTEPLYGMRDSDVLDYALPYLTRMFPAFRRDWIGAAHIWRAPHAQPVVERHYSQLIPSHGTPLEGLYLASMAQVYPEDRGTNYAVREGKHVAAMVIDALSKKVRCASST